MTSPQSRKNRNNGYLPVFVILVVLLALSYFRHWGFLIPAIGLLVIWISFCRIKWKKEKRELNEAFEAAFATFRGNHPHLELGSRYGYRSFTVVFATKEEMKLAFDSGHLKAFRDLIAERCQDGKFDINQGFVESYVDFERELHDSLKTHRLADCPLLNELDELRKRHY